VASRASAAELVVEDGVIGRLTPPGDVDALVAALEPLMRDPGSAIAMGARARALAAFGLDAEADKIADVYSDVLVPRLRVGGDGCSREDGPVGSARYRQM
jgi:mannosyltransferase